MLRYWKDKLDAIDLALGLVSLVFLVTYCVEVLVAIGPAFQDFFNVLEAICYVIFGFDILMRVSIHLSTPKAHRRTGKFLIGISIPVLALVAPALRSLRLFRLVLALRSVSTLMKSKAERAGLLVLTTYPVVVFFGAVSVLDAEKGVAGATITNIKEALWWALATSTTVGDGALYPVSDDAKIVASALMFTGVIGFSTITALVSSWVINSTRGEPSKPGE